MYKKMLQGAIVVGIMFVLAGCINPIIGHSSNAKSSSEDREYEYSEDSEFEIIHEEKIKDGTANGIQVAILVHRETKVMYMQTVKFQAGYGVGLEIMLDENGDPLLHEE